jgi:hypothetical protein
MDGHDESAILARFGINDAELERLAAAGAIFE